MTWQSGTVTTNGIRVHYHRTGGGKPPFLMLHGRTGMGLLWTRIARVLAADYDVIMPDLRGHGRTDAPDHGYDHPSMVQDMLGLLDALKLDRVILMGGSMGGAIATRLAAHYPDRVEVLVLLPRCWEDEDRVDPAFLARKIPRKRAQYRAWNAMSRPALVAEIRAQCPAWDAEDVALAAEAWKQVHENVTRAFAHDLTQTQWQALMRQVRCPILILMGDVEPDNAETRRFCEQDLPICTFVDLHGQHTAALEDFATYRRHLLNFLASE